MDRTNPLDDSEDLDQPPKHTPAVWLALPFFAGCLTSAAGLIHPGYAYGLAMVGLAGAFFSARRAPYWIAWIILTGVGFGACWHTLRAGRMEDWVGEPGRADLFIEVNRVDERENNRWQAVGWVQTGPTDTRRRHVLCDGFNAPPIPGGLYVVSGFLSACGQTEGPRENWLRSQNISLRLTRAHVAAEIEPASFLAQQETYLGKKLVAGFYELAWEDSRGGSLLAATMVGQTRLLEAGDRLIFSTTGTLHLFAISGLHITGMAVALVWLGRKCRLSDRVGGVIALSTLWIYVEVTGGTPSACRAWIMAACILACTVLQRRSNPLQGLFLSCVITLVLDPQAATDAGFQLSYASVAGILLVGSPAAKYFSRPGLAERQTPKEAVPKIVRAGRWLRARIAEGFCISVAASTAGAPIVLSVFGTLCPGGIFANLLLVPLSGLPVILGMLSVGLSLFTWLDDLRHCVNSIAAGWLHGMACLAEILALIPFMTTSAHWRSEWIGACATLSVLGIMLWQFHQPASEKTLARPFVVLLVWLVSGAILV